MRGIYKQAAIATNIRKGNERDELKAPWRVLIGAGLIALYFFATPLVAFLEAVETVNPYKVQRTIYLK